ncbi:HMGL-like protein, partial [Helicosporidium sp. ATCC 50920]
VLGRSLPASVRIVEVGPRDGLQNEKGTVPTEAKVRFIDALAEAGLQSVEATSFVSPKWVPQLADGAAVMAGIRRRSGTRYPVLVPNSKGLEAALAAGAEEVAVFTAASEAFNKKNTNATIAESLQRFEPVVARARDAGLLVRGYVSCVVGCPYQGDVPPAKVAEVAGALLDLGCYEVSLGDTVGVGTPASVARMLEAVSKRVPVNRLAAHMHDTYGQALANVLTALHAGIAVVDASAGGLGGCPYAPGASGNVATEDVLYMLHGLGVETGVDLDSVVDAAAEMLAHLGRDTRSRAAQALLNKRSREAATCA